MRKGKILAYGLIMVLLFGGMVETVWGFTEPITISTNYKGCDYTIILTKDEVEDLVLDIEYVNKNKIAYVYSINLNLLEYSYYTYDVNRGKAGVIVGIGHLDDVVNDVVIRGTLIRPGIKNILSLAKKSFDRDSKEWKTISAIEDFLNSPHKNVASLIRQVDTIMPVEPAGNRPDTLGGIKSDNGNTAAEGAAGNDNDSRQGRRQEWINNRGDDSAKAEGIDTAAGEGNPERGKIRHATAIENPTIPTVDTMRGDSSSHGYYKRR